MKYISILLILASLTISGCMNPGYWDPHPDDGKTLFQNQNPEIEALHVEAYNYDLGIEGVEQNQPKANSLYLKAAKAGDPRSMMNYSINRFYGQGIEADPIDAFYWIDQARLSTQLIPDLRLKWKIRGFYYEVEKSLTKDQKKEARSKQK